MLPLHIKDIDFPSSRSWLPGRTGLRWIIWILCSITFLWIFGTLFVKFDALPFYPSSVHSSLPKRPHRRPHLPSHTTQTFSAHPTSPRATRVRDAFVHAYSSYRNHSFPFDELLPVDGGKVNNFNGWGVTLFDSLDTMWIMGLHTMFQESLELVAMSTFVLDQDSYAPFFETVIRYLGGALSAYALSGEPVLLARADDLGRMLLPAFNTPSGMPMYAVNTVTGQTKAGWGTNALWSEVASNQMEYKYLSHLTGRTEYFEKTEDVMKLMYKARNKEGIFPTLWDITGGRPANQQFSVGAFADSAHEYFLKQWLLSGRSETKARDLYIESANAIINNLLYITPKRQLLFVTDTNDGKPSYTFEHLSCFFPGLLALGVHTIPDLSPADKELHTWAAEGLAYTCWMSYADQATGLGPDEMKMANWADDVQGKWITHVNQWKQDGRPGGVPPGLRQVPPAKKEDWEYAHQKTTYLLRPESVESFYILWRTTGEERWREYGWLVFEAIERHSRTQYGYASISQVDVLPAQLKNEMPSYFLAETLKYLYLLFTDEDILPLQDWVFNTEAHPFPVFEWKPWERAHYNIT